MGIPTCTRAARTRPALREFARATGLTLDEVCFVGDDVNDVEAMRIAACGGAADAHRVRSGRGGVRDRQAGGAGAVREIIDPTDRGHPCVTPSKLSDYRDSRCGSPAGCDMSSCYRRRGDAPRRFARAVRGVEYTCYLHEQAVAIAAEAYARAQRSWRRPGDVRARCHERDHGRAGGVDRLHAVPVPLRPGKARRSEG